MLAQTFADTYLDPPTGVFYVARTPQRDNTAGWNTKAHFYRGKLADALRRARRNGVMGMTDPQAVAAIPLWLQRHVNKAATIKDSTGALIAPNVATDFAGLTSLVVGGGPFDA
jgi:hypothetical protein